MCRPCVLISALFSTWVGWVLPSPTHLPSSTLLPSRTHLPSSTLLPSPTLLFTVNPLREAANILFFFQQNIHVNTCFWESFTNGSADDDRHRRICNHNCDQTRMLHSGPALQGVRAILPDWKQVSEKSELKWAWEILSVKACHVLQIRVFGEYLSEELMMPCCKLVVAKRRLVPGKVLCPGEGCNRTYSYSWCFGKSI